MMANNRLYIRDSETGDHILLAKSFGHGWDVRLEEESLGRWLQQRDIEASYGNTGDLPTKLELVTENNSDA